MINFLQNRIPIRARLTLWYITLLAVTFTAFGVYLILRFQYSLRNAIDGTLQITVSKTVAALDEEDYIETGRLTFDHVGQTQASNPDFGMRIISTRGDVWDTYGAARNVSGWGAVEQQYSTQENKWRTYSQPILDSKEQVMGWVQAAQSLRSVNETIRDLRDQLLLGIPLILLFAGLGGYFLAGRALQPIDQITKTAREITGQDLSKRLDYRGSMDEVGRLAQTFDQMLARLQSSFDRERRFTSDAAHELRTPLTVLKGQIDVTLTRTRNPAEYENKLRELSVQVDRLIRLSNALLFLSRSDQSKTSFESTVINLAELLDVLVEQFQPLVDEKRLMVTTKIPAKILICGNEDHLIRLFMNLLENALKYTPIEGKISVTVVEELDEVQVIIYNSGMGISQEHLPHLFERFYRVDADRSSQSGGSGLGLAIASEITRQHGGRIDASSESGRGVTFTVRLPLGIK